jgi:hypothetical protein
MASELGCRSVDACDTVHLPPADDLLSGLHTAAADERYRSISEHEPYKSML